MHQEDVGLAGFRGRAPGRKVRELRGAKPPSSEVETFIAFGREMEAANLPVFNIWKRNKFLSVFSCKNDV